jgi:MOSC domain-containing protein YiiM
VPQILSVNVGRPRDKAWAALGRTSIDKRPVTGRVAVDALGLQGDEVSDKRFHGGLDQAVYAYAREDLDFWETEVGRVIPNGHFGENITTEGLDLTHAEVGTRLEVGGPGGVVLEIAYVRTPCNDFKGWMAETGYDPTAWVRRFAAEGRPGPYLRVLQPGTIGGGDPIEVVHRPGHGVTVRDMFRAITTERSRLPDLLVVEGLTERVRGKAEGYALGAGVPLPRLPEVI